MCRNNLSVVKCHSSCFPVGRSQQSRQCSRLPVTSTPLLYSPLSLSQLAVLSSDGTLLIAKLHPFRNTHFDGRLPWSRGDLTTPAHEPHYGCHFNEGFWVCAHNVWCYETKHEYLHLKMEIALKEWEKSLKTSSRCCLSLLLFSVSCSRCWLFSVWVCFFMNYLLKPRRWLQCMSEHL